MPIGKLLFALVFVSLTGCTTPGPSVRLRISGGEKITVDLKHGGIVGAENKEIKIKTAGFIPNAQLKKGTYIFGVEFKATATPRSIKIEDVTDEKALPLVDDSSPKLSERMWRFTCPPQGPEENDLRWLHEIDDGFRVYRFTIALNDGRQIVLYHAAYYAAFIKASVRRELGVEEP